jgi:hypothetical protein
MANYITSANIDALLKSTDYASVRNQLEVGKVYSVDMFDLLTSSNYAAARTKLGLGSAALEDASTFLKDSLSNIQELKDFAAVTDGLLVSVLGYYTADDGGGATFYWAQGDSGTENGGTIIESDVAGLNGRWKQVVGNTINLKTFGAKGDDFTDDTAAVKAALYASNNKELFVPTGTYRIKNLGVYVTLDRIKITGDVGATFIASGITEQYMIRLDSVDHVIVDNIIFDGNTGGVQRLFGLYNNEDLNGQRALIKNCTFQNVQTNGTGVIYPLGLNAWGSFEQVTSKNNTYINLKNLGAGAAKGFYCSQFNNGARSVKKCFSINDSFEEIAPVTDADAIHHSNLIDQGSLMVVRGASFKNIHKRCVKSQCAGHTTVSDCTFEYTNVNGLNGIDFQYGGGTIENCTLLLSNDTYQVSKFVKLDRFSSSNKKPVVINNLTVVGSASTFNGHVVSIEPENGQGQISTVNIANLDVTMDCSVPINVRLNGQSGRQVERITIRDSYFNNITSKFIILSRGQGSPTRSNIQLLVENVINRNGADVPMWVQDESGGAAMTVELISAKNNFNISAAKCIQYRSAIPSAEIVSENIDGILGAGTFMRAKRLDTQVIKEINSGNINLTADTITIIAHGFAEDTNIVFGHNIATPSGFAKETRYYVKVVDADTIQLKASVTGDVIVIATAVTTRILQLYDVFGFNSIEGTGSNENRDFISSVEMTFQHSEGGISPVGSSYTKKVFILSALIWAKDIDVIDLADVELNSSGGDYHNPRFIMDGKGPDENGLFDNTFGATVSIYLPSGPQQFGRSFFKCDFIPGYSNYLTSATTALMTSFIWKI